MLFITKNATIKLGRNHAVGLIRQVQQLSHTREQKLSSEKCYAGEFHSGSNANNQHVQKLTESWREMALATGNLDVHAKLCVGDVRSNEIFYHKNHLSQFITDTEHRKLRRMMVQTSVKRFFSKLMSGDKFQTTYNNQMNSSLLQTF